MCSSCTCGGGTFDVQLLDARVVHHPTMGRVDLLLPSVVARLNLLHERGSCQWISKSLLPLLIYTHQTLQRLIHRLGYVYLNRMITKFNRLSFHQHNPREQKKTSSYETKTQTDRSSSSSLPIANTLVELEIALSNLITKMSTRMITSIPVSRLERGKAALWLESNLFR